MMPRARQKKNRKSLRFSALALLSCLAPLSAQEAPHVVTALPQETPAPEEIHLEAAPPVRLGTGTPADQIPWTHDSVHLMASGEQLGKFLRQFADQAGVQIAVSPEISGTVSGRFSALSPAELFNRICRAYGLIWFFFGNVLYVYSSDESITSVQELTHFPTESALQILGGRTLFSSGASVTQLAGTRMLVISGPPRYVELAQQILQALDRQERHSHENQIVIKVFPLNHALAYDITLASGMDTATTVDGVATTLSRLISQQVSNRSAFTFSSQAQPTAMVGTTSTPVFVPGAVPPGTQVGPGGQPVNPDGTTDLAAASSFEGATIVADMRANAVVVRDVRENMPFYEAAIRQLDIPVAVVEITAAIIDLEISSSEAFGISDVTVSGGWSDISGTIRASNVQAGSAIAQNLPGNLGLVGGVFGTTTVNATLNLLEQQRLAKILSRPHILTLDNFGAVIQNQDTFYVNSTGQYVSNLFNVTTGLSLQVVPHVVKQGNGHAVSLQVKIEDGRLSQSVEVSNLPTVKQSTLTTQALIGTDQSLLIGGLFVNSDTDETSGIPLLRRIPIIGPLAFSANYKAKANVERVFLITPRIVNLNSKNLGDYSEYFQPSPLQQQALEHDPKDGEIPVRKALPVLPSLLSPPGPPPIQPVPGMP